MHCATKSAIGCALGLALGFRAIAAESPRHFSIVPAGPGAFAAIARPGDLASLGNAGFVVGSDGVLVVDAFATAEAADELLSEIRRTTPLPVRWLVQTHYHIDHTGGSAVFAAAGAVVVAQDNVRAWVRGDWKKDRAAADRAARAGVVLPDVTYRDGITIWLGSRRVDILVRPGHTGGDSIVWVPESNVVFGGDLVWKDVVPNLADANTDAWIETLDGLLREHPSAAFVPGHGPVGKPLDVRFFRDYLRSLRLAVIRALGEGKSGEALTEEVKSKLAVRYSGWAWFSDFAAENVAQTEAELTGRKAYPPAPTP